MERPLCAGAQGWGVLRTAADLRANSSQYPGRHRDATPPSDYLSGQTVTTESSSLSSADQSLIQPLLTVRCHLAGSLLSLACRGHMHSLACGSFLISTARGISSFVLTSVFVSVLLLFAFLGTESLLSWSWLEMR